MFIMCQKCHTFYQVPKDLIVAQAMTFRCKKCGFTWTTHIDEVAQPTPNLSPEPEESAIPDDTEAIFGPAVSVSEKSVVPPIKTTVFSPVEEKRESSSLLPWLAFIFLLLNVALFVYRDEVSSWLSKEVMAPVAVQNVSFDVLHEKNKPQLRVNAQIVNTRSQTIPASPIVVTLFDAEGNQIQREEIRLSYKSFEPHQVLPIDYVIEPVNVRTRRMEIRVKDVR